MNRDAETVPAHHATPDLAELRRLLACASPLPWQWEPASGKSWPLGDESLVTTSGDPVLYGWGYDASGIDATAADRALIAAAVNALPALLDDADALRAELAHMTEARNNARAEVKRLTAKVERVRTVGDLTARHIGRRVRVETDRTLPDRVRLLREIATASNEAVRLTLEVIDHPEWFLMASFTLDTPCELLPC